IIIFLSGCSNRVGNDVNAYANVNENTYLNINSDAGNSGIEISAVDNPENNNKGEQTATAEKPRKSKYDYIFHIAMDLAVYDDLEDLNKFSDYIIAGKCIKVEKVVENRYSDGDPLHETPYTISYIEVTEIYKTVDKNTNKNFVVGDVIKITEEGGFKTAEKNGKLYKWDYNIEFNFPQENNEYLLFLNKGYNEYTKQKYYVLSTIFQSLYEYIDNKTALLVPISNNFTDFSFFKALGINLPVEMDNQRDKPEKVTYEIKESTGLNPNGKNTDGKKPEETEYDYDIYISRDLPLFKDIEALYDESSLIIKGKIGNIFNKIICDSLNVDPKNETPYNEAFIDVTEVYKATGRCSDVIAEDSIRVYQAGGLETFEKNGIIYKWDITPESVLLEEGGEYLLFLTDFYDRRTGSRCYGLTSIYQAQYEFIGNGTELLAPSENGLTDFSFFRDRLGIKLPVEKDITK
ncbi:MAG: hypothetical protein K0S55_1378, partial [Clostridia bacterium]|nr:hypothetical protein [Clostridia bacterium]